jgi:hypothetical protein
LVEVEVAVGIGVDDAPPPAQDVHLGAGDRVEEHVVGGVDDAVGAAADVVEGHRLQVVARVDDLAADCGAGDHRRDADRGEAVHEAAAGRAVAVGVQRLAVDRRADAVAVHGGW